VIDSDVIAKGFRSYERVRFVCPNTPGEPLVREVLRSLPVAAVLPLDLERNEIVLLRQFRLAAHLAGGKGNLIEIVAGYVEVGETPVEAARRECIEEIGVAPAVLVELLSYFPSPGISDERITLFIGLVDAAGVPEHAGTPREREETVLIRVPLDVAMAALTKSEISSGPLIVALQWLALNRTRLSELGERSRASS
jgi:ADP-ribose pyrophosphatase